MIGMLEIVVYPGYGTWVVTFTYWIDLKSVEVTVWLKTVIFLFSFGSFQNVSDMCDVRAELRTCMYITHHFSLFNRLLLYYYSFVSLHFIIEVVHRFFIKKAHANRTQKKKQLNHILISISSNRPEIWFRSNRLYVCFISFIDVCTICFQYV